LWLAALFLISTLGSVTVPATLAADRDPATPAVRLHDPIGCDDAGCPFIVRLAQPADTRAIMRTLPFGATTRSFRMALHGFAARMTRDQASALQLDPRVLSVTPDRVATISDTEAPASWGLDRIDQRDRPLSGTYDYDPADGAGVKAYVLDTGIRSTHVEFGGRVADGAGFVRGSSGTVDCHGHGTHVAGTIGGKNYGVAEAVTIVPVRVLNCQGQGAYSWIMAGLDWVIADHLEGEPAVANLSFGGRYDPALNAAVAALVADGVVVVVAAGNTSEDACTVSPASAPTVVTVGATDRNDVRTSFSNYGTCLDLFAPGIQITSAGITSDSAVKTYSGTSMASPHVAGIAAAVLGRYPNATQAQIQTIVIGDATVGRVSDTKGSPNRLAFTSLDTPAPGTLTVDETAPTSTAPVAALRSGPSLSGAKARVRLSWSGSDGDGSGIDHYTLARSSDGGKRWSTILSSTAGTSTNLTVPTSGSVRYRVRAVDAVGNVGPWMAGPLLSPRLIQQSSSSIRYRGIWRPDTSKAFSGGSVNLTKVTRAKAKYIFSGRSIGFVTTRAPNRGAVKVYINRTYQATVDLRASSTGNRVVAWQRTWSTSTPRTIKLVAIGSVGHRRVDLDAFVVLR
ncbi:MAG: S8 family serine peptidase, partial [Chloroflexi bacterium]|nr:S8 family serine peptidase [Chloroflexota bacterium]